MLEALQQYHDTSRTHSTVALRNHSCNRYYGYSKARKYDGARSHARLAVRLELLGIPPYARYLPATAYTLSMSSELRIGTALGRPVHVAISPFGFPARQTTNDAASAPGLPLNPAGVLLCMDGHCRVGQPLSQAEVGGLLQMQAGMRGMRGSGTGREQPASVNL